MAFLWPQMTDKDAEPMWEPLDVLKFRLLTLVYKTCYELATVSSLSIPSVIPGPSLGYLTEWCSFPSPYLYICCSTFPPRLSLFHSSSSFKTCWSATTQHTENRAKSPILHTRQPSIDRRASEYSLWDQSAGFGSHCCHLPAVWPWASYLPSVDLSFLTTHLTAL